MIIRSRDPFYEPFRELRRLQDEVDRMFEDFLGRRPFSAKAGRYPALNLYEDHDNLYVTTELPGVDAKDLDITVEEDSLMIKGVRRMESFSEGVNYHRRERAGGAFNRRITLPTRISAEEVSAETKDGVLTIVLPKAEEAKPRKINITVE